MTLVETMMVIGLIMMFFMMITMFVVVCKLCGVRDDILAVLHKMDLMKVDVDSIQRRVVESTIDISDITRYMRAKDRKDNTECELTDEEIEEIVKDMGEIVKAIEDDEDEIDIHLITPEDYHFANGYSKNELTYYPNTDQVKYFFDDDTCLAMEDIPEYIGDGLLFFGMNVQEPNIVYVRNHVLNADFRIEKFVGGCNE